MVDLEVPAVPNVEVLQEQDYPPMTGLSRVLFEEIFLRFCGDGTPIPTRCCVCQVLPHCLLYCLVSERTSSTPSFT